MPKRISLRKRLGLNVFSKILEEKIKLHELRTLFWESTVRCNLSCRHCGSDCRSEATVPDMPLADFLRTIDTITPHVNPNKVMVVIAGGEVLMRKDLEKAGLEIYKRGYPWGIVTNGMLLDAKRFESLLKAGLHSITVSIDSFAPHHNYIRRNEDSYDKAISALRLIVSEPSVMYDVVTCVTHSNFESLPEFKEFLIAEGVKRWRIFTIFPVGRGGGRFEPAIKRHSVRSTNGIYHGNPQGRSHPTQLWL